MRYRELVAEDSFGGMLDSKVITEEFKLIKRDCQPYLQQNKSPIHQTPMFRGLGGLGATPDSDAIVLKKQVRLKDRMSKDIRAEVHDVMNKWMTKKFGEPFRNALFTHGFRQATTVYGQPYVIFPIGNFTFLYHSQISDIYSTFESFKWNHDPIQPGESMIEFAEKFVDYISGVNLGTWKQDSIKQAIESKHEIAIRCKEYYAVSYDTLKFMRQDTSLGSFDQLEKELLVL